MLSVIILYVIMMSVIFFITMPSFIILSDVMFNVTFFIVMLGVIFLYVMLSVLILTAVKLSDVALFIIILLGSRIRRKSRRQFNLYIAFFCRKGDYSQSDLRTS